MKAVVYTLFLQLTDKEEIENTVSSLFPTQGSCVQNHWVAPR